MTFTVPGEPVSWQRLRTRGNVHFKATGQRQAAHVIALCARAAGVRVEPWPACVGISITAVYKRPAKRPDHVDPALWARGDRVRRPTRNRSDIDRVQSMVFDALSGIAYEDDGQIVEVNATKWYAAVGEEPHTLIAPYVLHTV